MATTARSVADDLFERLALDRLRLPGPRRGQPALEDRNARIEPGRGLGAGVGIGVAGKRILPAPPRLLT